MDDLRFYEIAAQVLPVLWLAAVLEARFLKRFSRRTLGLLERRAKILSQIMTSEPRDLAPEFTVLMAQSLDEETRRSRRSWMRRGRFGTAVLFVGSVVFMITEIAAVWVVADPAEVWRTGIPKLIVVVGLVVGVVVAGIVPLLAESVHDSHEYEVATSEIARRLSE